MAFEASADSDIYPNKESEVVGFSMLVGNDLRLRPMEPEMDQRAHVRLMQLNAV